jgi:hypothetical protein
MFCQTTDDRRPTTDNDEYSDKGSIIRGQVVHLVVDGRRHACSPVGDET